MSTAPDTVALEHPFLRRIIAVATGLAFAGMLASLAVVDRGDAGKLVFRWHWAALPLIGVGIWLGWRFWALLWAAEADPSAVSRRRLVRFSVGLAVMAVFSFAYPMRFIQEERRNEVFLGLGLAIVVLSAFGWLIWKTIQWVNENEPRDGEVEGPLDREPSDPGR